MNCSETLQNMDERKEYIGVNPLLSFKRSYDTHPPSVPLPPRDSLDLQRRKLCLMYGKQNSAGGSGLTYLPYQAVLPSWGLPRCRRQAGVAEIGLPIPAPAPAGPLADDWPEWVPPPPPPLLPCVEPPPSAAHTRSINADAGPSPCVYARPSTFHAAPQIPGQDRRPH